MVWPPQRNTVEQGPSLIKMAHVGLNPRQAEEGLGAARPVGLEGPEDRPGLSELAGLVEAFGLEPAGLPPCG